MTDAAKAAIARGKVTWLAGLLSKASGMNLSARLLEDAPAGSPPGSLGSPGAPPGAPGAPGAPGIAAGPAPVGSSPVAVPSAGARAVAMDAAARQQAMEQPLVKKAIDLFNARLISIEDDPG